MFHFVVLSRSNCFASKNHFLRFVSQDAVLKSVVMVTGLQGELSVSFASLPTEYTYIPILLTS